MHRRPSEIAGTPLDDFVCHARSDQIAVNHDGSIAGQDPHESLAVDFAGGKHGQLVLGH